MVTDPAHLLRRPVFLVFSAALLLSACGSDSPTGPSQPPAQQPPTVTSVSPNTGSTLGGTAITITGTNFAAGATVTIGGVAATAVTVQNATTITAQTPQRAAGAADVIVTVGTRAGSLPGGFTFAPPTVSPNAPPVITGITARGSRPNMPRNFADLNEEIRITASVTDAETPVDQLRYEWTAEGVNVSGSGREILWRAPASGPAPRDLRVTVTVVESYQGLNDSGIPVTAEHRVSAPVSIRVHDSVKEVRDLAVEFLLDFSRQQLSPEQVVRNFSDSCRGKQNELSDVRINQSTYTITAYDINPTPPVDIAFGGVCRFRGRVGDGCAYVPVRWTSTVKATGRIETVSGTDQVNAVYEGNSWRLCDSDFLGSPTSTGQRFKN